MFKQRKGFWNKLKVDWYRKGLVGSGVSKAVMKVVLPKTGKCRTFLDVGSGPGTLTLPLASAGKSVTALDPSPHMISALKEEAKALGLKKIKTVTALWGKVELKQHDAVICANVPELLRGSSDFFKDANELARKYVFIICAADPFADKFFYKDLFPLIYGRQFEPRTDYLDAYTRLHALGIFANIEIIEYNFDQPFDDMTEAMEFWREYMGLVTNEHDKKLEKYLKKKLIKSRKGLVARFHKKSAVIWWKKEKKK